MRGTYLILENVSMYHGEYISFKLFQFKCSRIWTAWGKTNLNIGILKENISYTTFIGEFDAHYKISKLLLERKYL